MFTVDVNFTILILFREQNEMIWVVITNYFFLLGIETVHVVSVIKNIMAKIHTKSNLYIVTQ